MSASGKCFAFVLAPPWLKQPKAPFWPSGLTERLATAEREVIFFPVLRIFTPFTLLPNPTAPKWKAPCVDADHSEEMAQNRGSVCCHRCSQDYQKDAAKFSDWTDFAITVLMLVCMFITLPISNFTELNLNKQIYSEWIFAIVAFFFFFPLAIKTHYVESSAVLLCFPSVHTVLGFWDFSQGVR